MKISSVLFNSYYSIKPSSSIPSVSSQKSEFSVEKSCEALFDTYYPSQPVNEMIEEDLYCRLQRHQRDFVPRINLYFCIVINHIRVVTNSVSTLFRRSWRYMEEESKNAHLQKRDEKKKKLSSAFIYINNLAEESLL